MLLALIAALGTLGAAPALAAADTSTSSNWSGYAVHRGGVHFKHIAATWRQPSATCQPGNPTYSAIWVGLGGFNLSSNALEQIGTEVDCSRSGRIVSSAWYELVPAASRNIRLAVRPGDLMQASVAVSGRRVTLTLNNRTRHKRFVRTVVASSLDVSSADWIVEAPSECTSSSQCDTLPLADFGTVGFTGANATTAAGRMGRLSSRMWNLTKISLAPGGRRYASLGPMVAAMPSALTSAGSAFSVEFAQIPSSGTTASAQRKLSTRAAASSRIQVGGRRRG
jgi:hypothetical protein